MMTEYSNADDYAARRSASPRAEVVPSDMVLVPRDPSAKQTCMMAAALLQQPEGTADNRDPAWDRAVALTHVIYRAMVAAAPQQAPARTAADAPAAPVGSQVEALPNQKVREVFAHALDALQRLTECERIQVLRRQSKTGWGFSASMEIEALEKDAWAAAAEAIRELRAALATIPDAPAGMVLVPREPTKAMRRAGADVWAARSGHIAQVTGAMYRAMLDAAPAAPSASEGVPEEDDREPVDRLNPCVKCTGKAAIDEWFRADSARMTQARCTACGHKGKELLATMGDDEVIADWNVAPSASEGVLGEPVAWQHLVDGKWVECSFFVAHGFGDTINPNCRPLYARPAKVSQRLMDAARKVLADWYTFASSLPASDDAEALEFGAMQELRNALLATPAGEQAAPLVATCLKAVDALHNAAGLLRAFVRPTDELGSAIIKDATDMEQALRAILATTAAVREPETALGNPAAPSSLSAQGRAPCSEPRATGEGELPARAEALREKLVAATEAVAVDWDGCEYDAVGGMIDIGDAIRQAMLPRVHAALASPPAAPAEPHPDTKDALHAAIMNMPVRPFYGFLTNQERLMYEKGFRDARHAAAELVAAIGQAQGERG